MPLRDYDEIMMKSRHIIKRLLRNSIGRGEGRGEAGAEVGI